MNRFDYSRIKTYQMCPKKHDYVYNQQIESLGNKSLICGKLFHSCLEGFYDDNAELTEKSIKEFEGYCKTGKLELEPDLLEYVLTKYVQYYGDDDKNEKHLAIEAEFLYNLSKTDEFYCRVDRIVYNSVTKLTTLRDTKTTFNKLKYTFDDVNYNTQLLTYVPFIENEMHIKVDQIQIDEVRLCKLQPVPINANGKPSGDKHRLELVRFDEYYDTLCTMGLEKNKEYINVLEFLQNRGDPMFNRVSAQLLDPQIVSSNMTDVDDTYENIKKCDSKYRIRGPLCNYCSYKELCKLDMMNASDSLREVEINKIKTN